MKAMKMGKQGMMPGGKGMEGMMPSPGPGTLPKMGGAMPGHEGHDH